LGYFTENFFHPKVYFPLILILLMAVLPLIPQNPFYEDIIVSSFFFGAMAMAWNLIGDSPARFLWAIPPFSGSAPTLQPSYTFIMAFLPALGMLAGTILSVLVAIGIGIPAFRLKSHFFAWLRLPSVKFFALWHLTGEG